MKVYVCFISDPSLGCAHKTVLDSKEKAERWKKETNEALRSLEKLSPSTIIPAEQLRQKYGLNKSDVGMDADYEEFMVL